MSENPQSRWQSGISSNQEAIRIIHKTGELSDVTFKIKQDEFKAHKFVLAACSSVFQTKLLDLNIHENVHEIKDESVTARGFRILLRFIYTNEIGTEEKMSIIEAYLAAEYFHQKRLMHECHKKITSWTITKDDVWQLLDAGFTIPTLKDKCITFIVNDVSEVFFSPSFLKISFGCLSSLLDSGVLSSVPVMHRLNRIMEWAANRHTKPVDYKLVRDAFEQNKLLGKLGIETLNMEELATVFTNYEKLLTYKDVGMLMKYSRNRDISCLPSWCVSPVQNNQASSSDIL